MRALNGQSSCPAGRQIEVGLRYRDMTAAERQWRVEEAMDFVGLAHRAAHPVPALSAGQQRRVEIARAIASRPRILFADEPAGDLDARGAAQMLQILWQLNRGGTTVVMATHSAECAAMADEVVYLVDGLRIEGEGGHAPARPPRLISIMSPKFHVPEIPASVRIQRPAAAIFYSLKP